MLRVERLGGLAGFGGAHLKSRGMVAEADLAPEHRAAVDALFRGGGRDDAGPGADMFRYRIIRVHLGREETVEVPEALVPDPLRACVRDELE